MGLVSGRRAIVTGGGAGIGLATCLRLRAEGAQVAVFERDPAAAEKAARQVDGRAYSVDVSDPAQVERAVEEALRDLGGVDLLVNNAGVGSLRPFDAYRPEEFDRLLAVNLGGVFHCTRCVAPRMRAAGGGAIVNNLSATAERPTPGEAPYAAAKAGALALTRSAALEYGPTVRVNAVSPGVIRCGPSEVLFQLQGGRDPVAEAAPLGRSGSAEEVADVILFLCSDLARYMTGQNLVVDGGLTLPQAGIDPLLRGLLAPQGGEEGGPSSRNQSKKTSKSR